MSYTLGYLQQEAIEVVGDNIRRDAFTNKQLLEAENYAATMASRFLGLTYLEKDNFLVDANGYINLGNEVITTLKVYTVDPVIYLGWGLEKFGNDNWE
jgi:hypothetical protein